MAEQANLTAADLDQGALDTLFTLAALSKRDALLLSHSVCQQLSEDLRALAGEFNHPLAEDLALFRVHELTTLTEPATRWVEEQAGMILGFTLGSLRA